jgi:hypothetical protein
MDKKADDSESSMSCCHSLPDNDSGCIFGDTGNRFQIDREGVPGMTPVKRDKRQRDRVREGKKDHSGFVGNAGKPVACSLVQGNPES